MPSSEFGTIARLAALFRAETDGVTVGIGDDAAVMQLDRGSRGELVWTVDAQVEGQHFRRDWMSLEDVGWRSFVAAASDLAAMGAEPWCALSALVLPGSLDDGEIDALTRGQAAAAKAVGCAIVGGNLSRGGELSVTTTLLGRAESAVRRVGAREGDGVWLAGGLGLATLGLRALEAGRDEPVLQPALMAFRRPKVNVDAGRTLAGRATAAIDVSDGLAQDAAHLAGSSGVALVIDEATLEAHVGEPMRSAAAALGVRWLEPALSGGEDYALLATSAGALPGFTRIGDVEAGSGVWLRCRSGERRAVPPLGFDHFST